MLCSICTIMTMSLPAFAVEFENKGNNTDIQFKKIMESVYEQLVAQNAEDIKKVKLRDVDYRSMYRDGVASLITGHIGYALLQYKYNK